jgi:hypothetical protein
MTESTMARGVIRTTVVTARAAAPSSRTARRRALGLAVIILTAAAVAVGTWLIVARVARGGATPVAAATAVATWTPIASPSLEQLEVIHLKKQLVRAGYSIKVDGTLDPITKSALADYLQLDPAHPLSPFLASALEGTVITGFRNGATWNSRFGLHRLTKFVERPLTGPGGQLDANGNLRAPLAAVAPGSPNGLGSKTS